MNENKILTADPKLLAMGAQHTFVMFGATVLVPLLTGLDIGVTLFAAGIGTWIFHIVTKFKVIYTSTSINFCFDLRFF